MKTIRIACDTKDSLPISALVCLQGELKSLSEIDYSKLKSQILETGFAFPVFTWKSPENVCFIISGHQRVRTLLKLQSEGFEIPSIPVVYIEADNIKQARRRVLQDVAQYGKVEGEGLYEFMTSAELGMSDLDSFRLPDINLDSFETEFFKDPVIPGCDEDDIPPAQESRVAAGDLWKLGDHRLLCGDSTVTDNWHRLVDSKVEMTFTSPPYNLGASAKLHSKMGEKGNIYDSGHDDDMDSGKWLSLISAATSLSLQFSRYAFWNVQPLAGNRTEIWEYAYGYRKFYSDLFIWDKTTAPPSMAERVVNSRFEMVYVFTSDENPNRAIRIAPQFRGTLENVYASAPQRNNEFSDVHGATFPVHFPEWFITKFCPEKGAVIDPFSGTGTTLIACEKTGRRCFGMDIDPKYCSVILARWEKYTGRIAEKI